MIDEKILPGHFMTFKYIKGMKQTLSDLMNIDISELRNAFDHLGPSYQFLPHEILPSIFILHSSHKDVNYKKMLCEIESCIKEVYEKNKSMKYEHWKRNKGKNHETLKILFCERKYALCRIFMLTKESFDAFKTINNNLLDTYNRMVDKMAKLYSSWLSDEEEGWQNDCQVCGKIIVSQSKENLPHDSTESDYKWMAERIEELESNRILINEFSGTRDKTRDAYKPILDHDKPNITFSLYGAKAWGNLLTCKAFRKLQFESLYTPQDILRIKYFHCDVHLTHQQIINNIKV